jgi:tetratricopeptide (TPR) repeat protein
LQEGVDSVCQYVYQTAAAAFVAQLPFEDEGLHPKLLVKAARSLKSNGDFDQALARLEQALALQKDEPSALAEMADCFEMTNESRKAKLLFREAFYLGACAIEVETLRSQMLREVLDSMEGYGYSAQESREWLAVHSVIQGAFSVKRELKPLEVGHLKQAINTLKTEVQAKTPNRNLLVPRLINKYFWLIDHYLSVKEDRSKIEDILLNIKLLDPRIHELYTH